MPRKHKLKPYMIICTVVLAASAAVIPLLYRYVPRTVTVVMTDSGSVTTSVYETTAKCVGDFLKKEDIDYDSSADLIDTPDDTPIKNGTTVSITKAFSLDITADGKTVTVRTTATTVGKALSKAGISTGTDDIVTSSSDAEINCSGTVTVTRVSYDEFSEETVTPCEKETQYDDSAPKGEESVVQQGQDRIVRNTYRITYHDGKQVSKDLTGSETTQEMINEITSIGTSTAGTTDSGISYSDKFQVKAFAYTAPEGACGAYGGLCRYGTIAVDPSIIPLGTQLYIDGYGYAYANDTGGAIKGYSVDLFMESESECRSWGVRYTTVYVLS